MVGTVLDMTLVCMFIIGGHFVSSSFIFPMIFKIVSYIISLTEKLVEKLEKLLIAVYFYFCEISVQSVKV